MFYHQQENKYVNENMEFTIGDVTYPPQWLNQTTLEQKQEIGLEEVTVVGEHKDPRYYWTGETLEGSILTITATPKDLADVQNQAISNVNQQAYTILLPSDYLAAKAWETNTTVPTAWAEWREVVRQTARAAIATITAATDVDTIASLVVAWPNDPNYVPVVSVESLVGVA